MYFWKCWRDTRSFALVFLVMAAAAMPITALVSKGMNLQEGFGPGAFLSTFALILFVVALGLGTIGAIQEFTDKTAHFLFTKPRPRFYFVWAGWVVGCAELLAIALMNLLTGWLTLAHYGKSPLWSVLFGLLKKQNIGGVLLYTLFVYCLTYAMTVVLRNGLKGLGASMGIIMGLAVIAAAIRARWQVDVPIPVEHIGSLPMVASNLIWISVALLFVFAAQLVVERAEI
jgi:ABC-type transport system involved in multi-copper enzyme maturation permease subunit